MPGMAVLLTKQVWRRPRAPRGPGATDEVNRLTPTEQANVLAALRVLRVQHGTVANLAKAMGLSWNAVQKVYCGLRKPSAGMALRVARVAGAPVESVLGGTLEKKGGGVVMDEPVVSRSGPRRG